MGHADLGMLLGFDRHHVLVILLNPAEIAQPARGVSQRAHRHQGHVAQRGFLEGEPDCSPPGRGSVRAHGHRARGPVGRPPRTPDDYHPAGRVAGHLPGHRPEQQARQLAVPAAAGNDHIGGPAAFAEHLSSRSGGQVRPDQAGAKHRLGIRQNPRQDLLAMPPGQLIQWRSGRQLQVIRGPRQADRQRRTAEPCFPDRPAQRLLGARRSVVAGHNSVWCPDHRGLLCFSGGQPGR